MNAAPQVDLRAVSAWYGDVLAVNEVTATFPELAGLGGATGGRAAVLDGEVVAIDESGRPYCAPKSACGPSENGTWKGTPGRCVERRCAMPKP